MDGAVFREFSCCGIGVVIRNERGEIIGALSKKVPLALEALAMEAKVAEEGIILARDLGLWNVVVEGDSLTVMNALSGLNIPPSSIQKVVEGSMRFLQGFNGWEAKHVRRCNNGAAHSLAKYAKFVSDCVIWVKDTPPIIENQVCLDVCLLGICLS